MHAPNEVSIAAMASKASTTNETTKLTHPTTKHTISSPIRDFLSISRSKGEIAAIFDRVLVLKALNLSYFCLLYTS